VLAQIQTSESLNKLKEVIDQLSIKLNSQDMDRLAEEKKTIDVRVDTQRYAFVSRRKEHFDGVENELSNLNKFFE